MTAKKSAAHHALTGTAPSRRTGRLKPGPGVAGIGPPPSHLSPDIAEVWRELANALPVGVCRASDRLGFEMLVRATVRMRGGDLNAAGLAQLRLLADNFALTPHGRQSLDVAPLDPGRSDGPQFEF